MVLFTYTLDHSEALEFIAQDIKSGLIFKELSLAKVSYDSFSLIYHTNLTDYFQMRSRMKSCMNKLNTNFFTTGTEPRRAYYNHLLDYMQKSEMEINTFRTFNRSEHRRNKRAIEWVGKLMNVAFGVMDAETARDIDKKINELVEDTYELKKLNMETTTFVKENLITDKDNIENLAKKTNELIDRVENIKDAAAISLAHQEMDFIITTIWNSHQYFSNQILKHLEGAIYGKVSQLIPVESLRQDLITLENLLPEKQKLPINIRTESALNIFKFSTTRATLFKNKMLIEINIPKVDRETYNIYEIIPIPFKYDNISSIIVPTMTHVLINMDSTDYIPVTESEVTAGTFNSDNVKIVKPQDNVYHDFSYSCEMNIFMNTSVQISAKLCNFRIIPKYNLFIPLNQMDQYYLFLNSPVQFQEFCSKAIVQKHSFESNGILTLSEDCRMRTKHITLRPRLPTRIYSTNVVQLSTDFMNLSDSDLQEMFNNFTRNFMPGGPIHQLLIQDSNKDYNNLIQKAEEALDQAKVETKMLNYEKTLKTTEYTIGEIMIYFIFPSINFIFGLIYLCVVCGKEKEKRISMNMRVRTE